jgi:hypothetical protein
MRRLTGWSDACLLRLPTDLRECVEQGLRDQVEMKMLMVAEGAEVVIAVRRGIGLLLLVRSGITSMM